MSEERRIVVNRIQPKERTGVPREVKIIREEPKERTGIPREVKLVKDDGTMKMKSTIFHFKRDNS